MYGSTADNKSGVLAMMCWGASNFTGFGESEDQRAALKFHVQAEHFTGEVSIVLSWLDTYVVGIGEHEYTDVYCDQLTELIDNVVELKGEA